MGNRIKALFFAFLFISSTSAFAAEQVFFYHTDPAGTPLAMTDTSGNVVWRADYKPFGEENTIAESQENDKRFVGKEKDEETGHYYFGARYMDPKTGRFTAVDPVRAVDPRTSKTNENLLLNPQNLNPYAYSLNNPYRYVDLDGNAAVLSTAKTFLDLRQQMIGWAPSWLQEILMPLEPSIGPIAIESSGEKIAANVLADTGNQIAKGHAFLKHVIERGEFEGLGIRTRQQFSDFINDIIKNARGENVKQLSSGRSAYWDDTSSTVVIRNPKAPEGGTAFRPTAGKKYFTEDLR